MSDFDLQDAGSYSSPRATCDVIMKGGITSGVVYPRAVCRLATRYRLKNLGGASAGAIAAAFAAAAERARGGNCPASGPSGPVSGFVALSAVPTELGSALGQLFQPSRSTRPAYDLLAAWLEPGWGPARKAATTWVRIVRGAPLAFLLTVLVAAVPVGVALAGLGVTVVARKWPWTVALAVVWLLVALIAATLVSVLRLVRRTLEAMAGHGFGLCDGHTRDPRVDHPPLTDWLARKIDDLAGLGDGGPLTFGQLWGESAAAIRKKLRTRQSRGGYVTAGEWRQFQPEIDLRVMTTDLTHGRPYAFPFTDEAPFYFCETCWQAYFPDPVMQHLVQHSALAPPRLSASSDNARHHVTMRCPTHGTRVRHFPDAAELPVVVAARISLSFPGLISAVPLLSVDYARAAPERTLIVTWFSDGGIASNFPMHFFDAPWPRRPTFGINLQPQHPDYQHEWVWRPRNGSSGIVPRSFQLTSMVGFASATLRTMQNWADTTQITLPGFRDRVVEVRAQKDEGGMNLKMAPATIQRLAQRGSDAAETFEDFDLDLHEWIRYRAAMSSLSDVLDTMQASYPTTVPGLEGYSRFLRRYGPAPADFPHLDRAELAADTKATRRLMRLVRRWVRTGYPLTTPQVPEPRPRLRQTPPL